MFAMNGSKWPIVMPVVPDQRWDCHSCTRCCRDLVVELFEADRRAMDARDWSARLGAPPYIPFAGKWVLNKRADSACVFLQEDGRCRLHAEIGPEAKPVVCRLYPFTLVPSGGRWLAGWRFDCPSIARSRGGPIATHRKELNKLRGLLPAPAVATGGEVALKRNRPAGKREVDALLDPLNRWLGDEGRSWNDRLVGAACLIETLQSANLSAVRDERFVELIEMLAPDLPLAVTRQRTEAPTRRQHALFRQLAFAHTEHLTLHEYRSLWTRLSRRFGQLGSARRFRRGVGRVPPLPGADAEVTFDAVHRVGPASDDAKAVSDMVGRFVRMRVVSRYQFGPPYYGWPVLDGLRALWMSVGILGWLARCFAAGRGAPVLGEPDVVLALALVDGAIGRSPSLGTVAERLRLDWLANDSGIERLLHAYRLVDSA